MPLIIFLLLILVTAATGDTVKGIDLLGKGRLKEGYVHLEECFQKEEDIKEKGRIAWLLAFGDGISTSNIYYARFALKYHPDLTELDKVQLEIRIADSFMEHGELKKAREIYQRIRETHPNLKEYVNYQLGYYFLNSGDVKKAYELWNGIEESSLKEKALRSIGRYWETMKFPGNISELSKSQSFVEGFSSSVDERDETLTLADLNNFVSKKSSPSMIALLIEKHPLFISKPCDFVKWYRSDLNLSNQMVFPYLKNCLEKDRKQIKKITEIAQAQSKNSDEKMFLVSLLVEQGQNDKACLLASKEGQHIAVLATCPEASPEIIRSISQQVAIKNKDLLRASRVIRSSANSHVEDQRQIIKLVGEQYFLAQFHENPESLLKLVETHKFSHEGLLSFAILMRNDKSVLGQMRNLFNSKVAKEIFDYLEQGKPISTAVCGLAKVELKKVALEAKLRDSSISESDLACAEDIINSDETLLQLASERIIESSERVFIDRDTRVTSSLLSDNKERPIKMPSGNFGKELSLLLKVQNYSLKQVNSPESMLKELKAMRRLRAQVSTYKWTSPVVTKKATAHFNKLLDQFLEKNKFSLTRLKLESQLEKYIQGMRFS